MKTAALALLLTCTAAFASDIAIACGGSFYPYDAYEYDFDGLTLKYSVYHKKTGKLQKSCSKVEIADKIKGKWVINKNPYGSFDQDRFAKRLQKPEKELCPKECGISDAECINHSRACAILQAKGVEPTKQLIDSVTVYRTELLDKCHEKHCDANPEKAMEK